MAAGAGGRILPRGLPIISTMGAARWWSIWRNMIVQCDGEVLEEGVQVDVDREWDLGD